MENGEERDDFDVSTGVFHQPTTVFQHPSPVRNAMIAVDRQGVIFKDGCENESEVHAVIVPPTTRFFRLPRPAVENFRDYLRISEAAEYLGVSPNTLRNWENAGKIAAHRHPVNSYRLFKKEELDALLRQIQEPREPSKKAK